MMLRNESVHPVVKTLNTDDARSISLEMIYLDYIRLYRATMKRLPIIIKVAKSFMKTPNTPASFHTPIFYNRAKKLLQELMTALVDYLADFTLTFAALLNKNVSHKRMGSIPLLQMFFSCM